MIYGLSVLRIGILFYSITALQYVLCQDRETWSTVAVNEVAQCRERNNCAANRAYFSL